MEINELLRIRALGNLFQSYESDLRYILHFRMCRRGAIPTRDFVRKAPGSFQTFLNEFRVARSIQKRKKGVAKLLDLTMKWVETASADDVDEFARRLRTKGLTHGKTATSLASKVLFLNNPWTVFPCDALNKTALDVSENRYSEFRSALQLKRDALPIDKILKPVQRYMRRIELEFEGQLERVSEIGRNRLLDKLLWVRGQDLARKAKSQRRPIGSAESNLEFMRKLVEQGKSENEISESFFKRYVGAGLDRERDKDFIQKRIRIYRRQATRE